MTLYGYRICGACSFPNGTGSPSPCSLPLTIAVLYLLSTPHLHPYRCHSRQGQLKKQLFYQRYERLFRFGYLQVQYQHQQRVADIKVAHTDDRGSQSARIERNLYHPQRIKERRFVQSISCHHYILRQNRSAIKFHHQVLFKEAFAISELEISGEDIGETLSAQMGDSIQTSAGIMIVSPLHKSLPTLL